MRIFIRCLLLAYILISSNGLGIASNSYAYAQQPDYSKWGNFAMKQTAAKYHASIVDYLHVARTQVSPGIVEETFKLWVRDKQREFGVFITIQFYTSNDQIITIKYRETSN